MDGDRACHRPPAGKHKPDLVRLAEWIAQEGDQEAIAILVDSGMELVVWKDTS